MRIEKPHRVSRSYVQHLDAGPADVFPLLCPVREVEWVEGWDPGIVISESGIAELGCIFTTPAGETEAIWTVTEFLPDEGRIAFLKVTPGQTVAEIRIALEADGSGGTRADVTYAHTALSAAGRVVVDEFTEEAYQEFMRGWEKELNGFLAARP